MAAGNQEDINTTVAPPVNTFTSSLDKYPPEVEQYFDLAYNLVIRMAKMSVLMLQQTVESILKSQNISNTKDFIKENVKDGH